MRLALALLFTLLLSVESLWLFALSAHIARFMELAAPIFWMVSLCTLWVMYVRDRSSSHLGAARRMLLVGIALAGAGAILGFIAITSV
jgi:hypothetical protein